MSELPKTKGITGPPLLGDLAGIWKDDPPHSCNDADDPSPEWTDELIRLCERTDGHPNEYRYDIHEHLGKRGER